MFFSWQGTHLTIRIEMLKNGFVRTDDTRLIIITTRATTTTTTIITIIIIIIIHASYIECCGFFSFQTDD